MVVNGIDFPERILKEVIGELYLQVDHLGFLKKQYETEIFLLKAKLEAAEAENNLWRTGQHPT